MGLANRYALFSEKRFVISALRSTGSLPVIWTKESPQGRADWTALAKGFVTHMPDLEAFLVEFPGS